MLTGYRRPARGRRGGGRIREAVASLKSKVALRRESLQDPIHAARILVLEREHLEASMPELQDRSDAASKETAADAEAMRKVERD